MENLTSGQCAVIKVDASKFEVKENKDKQSKTATKFHQPSVQTKESLRT